MFRHPMERGLEGQTEESVIELLILLIFGPAIHRPLEYPKLDVDKPSLNKKAFKGRHVDEQAAHLLGPRPDEVDVLVYRRFLGKGTVIGYGVDLVLEKLEVSAWCNVAEAKVSYSPSRSSERVSFKEY